MNSKIVWGAMLGLLALALIVGSVYVILRPETVHAEGGRGNGRGAVEARNEDADVASGERLGRGPSDGRGWGSGETITPLAPTEWVALVGTVVAVDDGELTVQTDAGTVVVHIGPTWYWQSQTVTVTAGDEISVLGYDSDGEFTAGQVTLAGGQVITLRNSAGMPVWAGRGGGRSRNG